LDFNSTKTECKRNRSPADADRRASRGPTFPHGGASCAWFARRRTCSFGDEGDVPNKRVPEANLPSQDESLRCSFPWIQA